jgi:hypothetical protein
MVKHFTKQDDERLVEYLAANCPVQEDRGKMDLYKQLVQNVSAPSMPHSCH